MTPLDNSPTRQSKGDLILFSIAIAVLFLSFLRLGFWQLDRAQELRTLQSPQPEKPVVQLLDVAQPGTNLDGSAVNRIVKFTGRYVASYRAAGQSAPRQENQTQIWSVGLLEIPDIGAILVARSVISTTKSESAPAGEIEIVGRLMPRQFDDRTNAGDGDLARIDSALIVNETDLALFDGFVIAQSERVDGKPSPLVLIADSPATPTVPGFYWQHIAYVAIWWLAAAVVLFLPFYQRFRERTIHGQPTSI